MLKLTQLILPLFLVAACAQEEGPQTFIIGTGAIGGNYEAAGLTIARSTNQQQEQHGFVLRSETSAGSIANIEAIISGNVHFGIAQADHQYHAVNGQDEWQERGPQKSLRAVLSLYTEVVTLVAGADSEIRSIADLKGKRVDIGVPGSGTRRNAIDALSVAGIDWEADLDSHAEPTDLRLAQFMHNELDAFFYTISHPNTMMKFATFSVRGARFVPLSNIERLTTASPYYSRSHIPIHLYSRADNTEAVETIGINAVLLTSASVSDEVVYAVTKAIFEDLDDSNDEMLRMLDPDDMLDGLAAPIHAGAMRYYAEIGAR